MLVVEVVEVSCPGSELVVGWQLAVSVTSLQY